MLPTCEVPVIVLCSTGRLSLGWFFSHIFFWQQLIMRLQLPSFQWCSRKMRVAQSWSRFSSEALLISVMMERQLSASHRSVLSFLVPGCWRRPGSSSRRKSWMCRASCWMRRRNESTRKRWSGGCRNAWCFSPRWVPRPCLEKLMSLFLSARCSPSYFIFVHLYDWCYKTVLCIMGAVRDTKPVFRASLEWKYQCLLKLCSCSPHLGSCCAGDTGLCLSFGIAVRAENWIMLLLECFEPLRGIYNGFGCIASFPKENEVAAPCQLFLWKNNLQRIRDLPSSYAGSLFKCNGKH